MPITYRTAHPKEQRAALELVLSAVQPGSRAALVESLESSPLGKLGPLDALVIATEGSEPLAAIWAQPHAGNVASFWPPEPNNTSLGLLVEGLLDEATRLADVAGIEMSQVLFEAPDDVRIDPFSRAGFEHLAELHYLGRPLHEVSSDPTESEPNVEFEPFEEQHFARLRRVVAATYEETLDCAGLAGKRSVDDTLAGYRATGHYRSENWSFARQDGQDVGVVLLAEHETSDQFELVYMGLTQPARGHGLGKPLVQHALDEASRAGAEQIMVAVDARNVPAQRVYEQAGFLPWAKRWVYVR